MSWKEFWAEMDAKARAADERASKMGDRIKRRLALGERKAALAQDFGVARSVVYGIADGRTWRHVDAAAESRGQSLREYRAGQIPLFGGAE